MVLFGVLDRKLTCLLVLAAQWLLFGACGKQTEHQLKVIGGRPVGTESPAASSVVRILVGEQTRCTGVLIARDLVLFASHCLSEGEQGKVQVGFPLSPEIAPIQAKQVQAYRQDSAAFFPLFDLSWARLSSVAPANYQAATLLLDPRRLETDTPLLISGFGKDCPEGNCPSVLTEAQSRFQSYSDQAHMPSLLTLYGQIEAGEGTTCTGDSGGPSFIRLDQRWYLVGITNGKHPIITPEAYVDGVADCKSGWTIQTFAGDYLSWLEKSSGTLLNTEAPRPQRVPLIAETKPNQLRPELWQDWFAYHQLQDSAWTTVHKLLEQLFVEERETLGFDWSKLLTDASLSSELLGRLERISVLGLGLPDQEIVIDDLRPLASLPALHTLNLRDVPYKGLEALAQVQTLKTLSITASFVTRPPMSPLGLGRLASQSLRELRLRGLALNDIRQIRWTALPSLEILSIAAHTGGLPASALDLRTLPQLTDLTVTDFLCDIPSWNPNPFGTLQSLTLRKSSQRSATPACLDPEALKTIPNVLIE